MESLDDTFGSPIATAGPRLRLVVVGVVLVVGVPVAAIGLYRGVLVLLAGAVGVAAARQTALALGGLVLPVGFALSMLRLPASATARLTAVGGVVIATFAMALFLITVPTAAFATGVIPSDVIVLYLIGTLTAIGTPVVTIAAALSRTTPQRAVRTSNRSTHAPRPGTHALRTTDGGRETGRLAGLLDEPR